MGKWYTEDARRRWLHAELGVIMQCESRVTVSSYRDRLLVKAQLCSKI